MESKQGGILVLVLGYFVWSDSPEKTHFTQVFFLDKQADPYAGYFVQNDILRYVTGKAEHSELQAQLQTDPPPLLPPPFPPMMRAQVDEAPAAEEEEAAPAVEEVPEEEEEQEEEEPYNAPPEDNTADDRAVAEALEADVAAEAAKAAPIIPEEKPAPKSWASMAGKLKEGGGALGPPKLQGWSLPAAAKAKTAMPAVPKFSAASSTMPVLPPPSTAHKAKAKAAEAGQDTAEVRLWVSRIPTEQQVENTELLECFTKLIADAGMTDFVEIDRKDLTKDWGYVTVWGQDVADMLVQHSKDRKLALRGKILKVQISHPDERNTRSPPTRLVNRNTGGKGGGEDGGADGGGRRPPRGKGSKGGNEAGGGKGGKGGADAGSTSAEKPKGGGRREKGEKGKGGGSDAGNWRS